MIQKLLTALKGINPFTTNENDSDPTGAEAVRTAVNEIGDFLESEVNAKIGEPDIVEGEGRYFNDAKIVVPVYDIPLIGNEKLLFDLPKGVDDELSQFNQLLDLLGVNFDEMEDIEGETVPIQFFGGNPVVAWDQLDGGDDTDKVAESGTEDNLDNVAETSDEDPREAAVNVEETTIGVEGDDD